MKRLLFVELVTVAVLAVVAGLGFDAVFLDNSYLLPVIGAALGGAAISGVVGTKRVPLPATMVLSLVGFLLWVSLSVLGHTMTNRLPTPETLSAIGDGLTEGWRDLLTVTLPAQDDPRLQVVAAFIVWISGAAGVELA